MGFFSSSEESEGGGPCRFVRVEECNQHNHIIAKKTLKKLNQDRVKSKIFCNYTIIVETRKFPVHKVLMAVNSDYFAKLFTSEMTEMYSTSVELKGLSAESVEALLNFLYTINTEINDANVCVLLEAADYLQVAVVIDLCHKHLASSINEQNIITYWMLASRYELTNVLQNIKSYVTKNYMSVLKHKNLVNLPFQEFFSLISMKPRYIFGEVTYDYIVNWVKFDSPKREQHIEALLKDFPFSNLSKPFFQEKVLNEKLVMNSLGCAKMIISALHGTLDETYDVFFYGGDYFPRGIRLYNKYLHRWSCLHEIGEEYAESTIFLDHDTVRMVGNVVTNESVQSHALATLETSDSIVKKVSIYPNPNENTSHNSNGDAATMSRPVRLNSEPPRPSRPFALMRKKSRCGPYSRPIGKPGHLGFRSYESVDGFGCTMHHDGFLYVAGGTNGDRDTNAVERFDFQNVCWQEVACLPKYRNGLSLVSCRDGLFAIGGKFLNRAPLNSCLRLDAWSREWINMSGMNQSRCRAATVVFQDSIYAIGGDSHNLRQSTSTAEKYFIDYNSWSYIASLQKINRVLSAFLQEDTIFVFGEEVVNGELKSCFLESYIWDEDKWEVVQEFDERFKGAKMIPLWE